MINRNRRLGGRRRAGFTLLEITIALIVIGIVAAIVIPSMSGMLGDAHESAALQHIRAIHTAQASYFAKRGTFATGLAQLGPPFLSAELARGERMGYRFAIVESPTEGYAVTARPVPGKTSGSRSFYSGGSLIIRHAPAGGVEATAESPELNAAASK